MNDAGETRGLPDMHLLFEAIRQNRDRLDACPRHFFGVIENIELGAKALCRRCGGELRLTDINQYVRGYEAHGGNGNDIVTGWKPETPQRKYFGLPTEPGNGEQQSN